MTDTLFGKRIKLLREKKGITQKQLAEQLGIPYQSVSDWERGVRTPRLSTIHAIANALNIPVGDLVAYNDLLLEEDRENSERNYLLSLFDSLNAIGKHLLISHAKTLAEEETLTCSDSLLSVASLDHEDTEGTT